MAHAGPKPVDVLLSELDFLNEYLLEIAERFRSEGRGEDAEIANSWAELPVEARNKICDLISR